MGSGCTCRGFGRGIQPAASNCPSSALVSVPRGDIGVSVHGFHHLFFVVWALRKEIAEYPHRYWSIMYTREHLYNGASGGYMILKSSPGCYHIVFNRSVDWPEKMRVVAWGAYLSGNGGLQRWHPM